MHDGKSTWCDDGATHEMLAHRHSFATSVFVRLLLAAELVPITLSANIHISHNVSTKLGQCVQRLISLLLDQYIMKQGYITRRSHCITNVDGQYCCRGWLYEAERQYLILSFGFAQQNILLVLALFMPGRVSTINTSAVPARHLPHLQARSHHNDVISLPWQPPAVDMPAFDRALGRNSNSSHRYRY